MKKLKTTKYGFVRPVVGTTHYGAGSLPKTVLQPTGQWDEYLPSYEPQFNANYDAYGCTVWGTENNVEIWMLRLLGKEFNYSERFIYILAGIRPPGGDPHKVAEAIRNKGLIDDSQLPMTQDFVKFIKPDPMTENYLDLGRKWLQRVDFKHEWLISVPTKTKDRVAIIKEHLQYTPICASVTAWFQDGEVYVDRGQKNTHWCVIFGFDDEKKAWKIFDSYNQSVKLYSFESLIEFAKGYRLTLKVTTTEQISLLQLVLSKLRQLLGLLSLKQPVVESQPADINIPPVPPAPVVEAPKSKFAWDTKENARHSCRVVMDEYSLQWVEKDLLCAVIEAESGFNTRAVNKNKNGTADYGIVQLNDKYWIGPGKLFPSIEEVFTYPEQSVRFMVESFQQGHLNRWAAYNNKSYVAYLPE